MNEGLGELRVSQTLFYFERDGIERDDIFRKNYYVNNY